jgi:two-component system nitrate/nitrite response regulator NarP
LTSVSPRSAARAIDLAIVDKNPLVLSALSELFEADGRFNLVLTVSNAESFLEAVDRIRLQVAVTGWVVPIRGGVAMLDALRERPHAPRIVVYSGSSDPDLPRKILAHGGAGFCSKSEPPETLLETVHAVALGRMVFPFVDVRTLRRDPLHALTPRERALLAALATGRTNAQLARDFGLSVNTVKFHLTNLYGKLALRNRAQAVALYYSVTRE